MLLWAIAGFRALQAPAAERHAAIQLRALSPATESCDALILQDRCPSSVATVVALQPQVFYEGTHMALGTVRWFNTTKGFGFIEPEDGGPDVFVRISTVERANLGTLREGQRVRYESVQEANGRVAAENLSSVG